MLFNYSHDIIVNSTEIVYNVEKIIYNFVCVS